MLLSIGVDANSYLYSYRYWSEQALGISYNEFWKAYLAKYWLYPVKSGIQLDIMKNVSSPITITPPYPYGSTSHWTETLNKTQTYKALQFTAAYGIRFVFSMIQDGQ